MFWNKSKQSPCALNAQAEVERWQRIRSLNREVRGLLCSDRPMFTVTERLREIEIELDALESLDAEPNH